MISRKFIVIFVLLGLLIAAPSVTFTQQIESPRPAELDPKLAEGRVVQNQIADQLIIPIIWDNSVLTQLRLPQSKRNKKIRITADSKYRLVPTIRSKYLLTKSSYTYQWINDFLESFGEEQYSATKRKIKISSFYRTVQRQRSMITPYKYIRTRRGKLKQVRNPSYNPNAAGFDSDHPELISLHCRALAIDISRKGLSLEQIEWIRAKLIELKKQDIGIFPIEERTLSGQINCFHVVIFDPVEYKKYKDKNQPTGGSQTTPTP